MARHILLNVSISEFCLANLLETYAKGDLKNLIVPLANHKPSKRKLGKVK